MTSLDTYVLAVSQRKACKEGRTNYVIAAQIQEHDVPLLLEIIRVLDYGLRKVLETAEDDSEEYGYARLAVCRSEELAATGSLARFGGLETVTSPKS